MLAALVLAVAASAAAASTIPFRVVAHDIAATKTTLEPFALVATSRRSAHRIVVDVPTPAAQPVLLANYRTSIVLGVFGPFGCKDGRVRVARVTQVGSTLTVHLVVKPLPPGTMDARRSTRRPVFSWCRDRRCTGFRRRRR